MSNIHRYFLIVSLCTMTVLSGCGSDGPELAAVSGTVTLDGTPLPNALVVFNPGNARPSEGRTNDEGYYELQYTRERYGAIIGTHQVMITSKVGVDEEGNEIVDEQELVPAKYNTETTLSQEVESGSHVFDFDLKS